MARIVARDFLAELVPEKCRLKPRERTARKELIVRLSQTGMRQAEIAQEAGCSAWWVHTVLKEEKKGKEPWYQISVKSNLADLRTAILTNNGAGIAGLTSNLINPSLIRDATQEEQLAHTYPYSFLADHASKEMKLGRRWLGYHLSGKKCNSDGFVIMNALPPSDRDEEELLHNDLPSVLDTAMYQRCFLPIFQHLQDRENAGGDKRRLQAKMSDLIQLGEKHLEAAQKQAEKEHFGNKHPKKKRAYCNPRDRVVRWASTKQEASEILENAKGEYGVVDKSLQKICLIYDHVQAVTPTSPNVLLHCADHAKVANCRFGPRTFTCQSQSPQQSRSP